MKLRYQCCIQLSPWYFPLEFLIVRWLGFQPRDIWMPILVLCNFLYTAFVNFWLAYHMHHCCLRKKKRQRNSWSLTCNTLWNNLQDTHNNFVNLYTSCWIRPLKHFYLCTTTSSHAYWVLSSVEHWIIFNCAEYICIFDSFSWSVLFSLFYTGVKGCSL